MKILRATLGRLLSDDSGVTAIEYGLLSAAVGVVLIGALLVVGSEMNSNFNTIATSFDGTKIEDDGAWPGETADETAGEEADTTAGGNKKSGDSASRAAAGGANKRETANGAGARGISGSAAAGRALRHSGSTSTSGHAAAVSESGAANTGAPSGLAGADRDTDSGLSAAAEADAAASYDIAADLLPALDDGAGQSWALAPEKAVAGAQEKTAEGATNAQGPFDVSDDARSWIGALILLLALALFAANFRRAARESERKRQVQEWQEAQAEIDNVVSLHAFKSKIRKAA